MKSILIIFCLTLSNQSLAKSLTHKLQVIHIKYNEENKNYDISFMTRAGIYHADKTHLECLEKSIESNKEINVEYAPRGLKIVKCTLL